MRRRWLIFIALLMAAALLTCKKPPSVEPGGGQPPVDNPPPADTPLPINPSFVAGYNTSSIQWQTFKASAAKGYVFTIAMTYGQLAYSNADTKITVVGDSIIARDYVTYKFNAAGKEIIEQWSEDKAHINAHGRETWFITLDDIYKKAKTEWLNVDTAQNIIYFETKNNGLISKAGYQFKTCQDDCFVGVNITAITAL